MKQLIIMAVLLTACTLAHASIKDFVPRTEAEIDRLADIIYIIEGKEKTNYPFGIKSVSCSGYSDCRKVCKNTIRNNIKRWEKSGKVLTYLEFLAKRYCPIGANDDNGTNKFWLKNLLYYLEKGEK